MSIISNALMIGCFVLYLQAATRDYVDLILLVIALSILNGINGGGFVLTVQKRMIEWNEDMDYKLDDEQIETTLLQIVVFFTLVGVFSTIVGILVVPTITCVICIISCGAQIFYALIYKNELIYDIAEDIIVTGILEDDKYIIK